MANYKLVKYCRLCKTRFTVEKSDSRKVYCEECSKRISEEPKNEDSD
jgi:PHP family Zn ribbon phosphoesterase